MPNYRKLVADALAAAGVGGAAMVTAPDDAEAAFAGKLARTANLKALKTAEQMAGKGATKEDVFDATGWFRGADKQWRFEIPDTSAVFRNVGKDYPPSMTVEDAKALLAEPKLSVGDRFRHKELYAAYPELRTTGLVPFLSRLEPNTMAMVTTTPETMRPRVGFSSLAAVKPDATQTMLHELQHGIQRIEGFAPGGGLRNPAVVRDAARTLNLRDANLSDLQSTEEGRRAIYDSYRRLAGEVEARNVETRSRFPNSYDNPNPRPWETEEVPLSRQIVLPPNPHQFMLPFPRGR